MKKHLAQLWSREYAIMAHSSVYGYWLVDYPHFRSLFVFPHYMKMRWVPTACNSDVTLRFIRLYLGFYHLAVFLSNLQPWLKVFLTESVFSSLSVWTQRRIIVLPWNCYFRVPQHNALIVPLCAQQAPPLLSSACFDQQFPQRLRPTFSALAHRPSFLE